MTSNDIKQRLPKEINSIFQTLYKSGFECYLVGGSIRDLIIGNIPNDWDMCTNALPEEICGLFPNNRILTHGIKYGTVAVVYEEMVVEITTYRSESGYSDSRHPDEISFKSNIYDDLSRRDFTINAIAYSPQNGIVDSFGGIEDIRNKIIRTVGSPDQRFHEDPLRIIRALRIASKLNFLIDEKTSCSIHENRNLISTLSRERVGVELKKMLEYEGYKNIIDDYYDVIQTVFPELSDKSKNRIVNESKNSINDYEIRLSILLFDLDKDEIDTLIGRVRMIDFSMAKSVVEDYHAFNDYSQNGIEHYISKNGFERTEKLSFFCDSKGKDGNAIRDVIKNAKNSNKCLFVSDLQINGEDLIPICAKKENIGKMLNILLDNVIDGNINNNKEDLVLFARTIALK